MSIFKRNNELHIIKTKQDFIRSINKGAGINYIGTNQKDCMGFIGDMVTSYIADRFECNLAILSSLTPTQICYKLSDVLKGYDYDVETREVHLTVVFRQSLHRIHILHYPTYGIDFSIFEQDLIVILHVTHYDDLRLETVKEIHKKLINSNVSIAAAYPNDEDISLKTFLKMRRYISNMGFIAYDEEIGDTCFIDIFNRKYVMKEIRDRGTTT